MTLNHDCIRDLLLYLEGNLTYDNEIIVNNIDSLNYTEEDLLYTTERLIEAGYIKASFQEFISDDLPIAEVQAITYRGHEFLDTIRDTSVWTKTKNITSKFSSTSIQLISSIASQIISQIISASL